MSGFLDRFATWIVGPPPPDQFAASPARTRPAASVLADDPRLPNVSRPLIAQLLQLVADIEARTQEDPVLVSALTEVRQMRDEHLPRLVASYAEIPATHRAEIFRETGRSASYNLNQAIERMVERLETLSRSLAQDDIESFADNLRFIEHRYGSDDPLA